MGEGVTEVGGGGGVTGVDGGGVGVDGGGVTAVSGGVQVITEVEVTDRVELLDMLESEKFDDSVDVEDNIPYNVDGITIDGINFCYSKSSLNIRNGVCMLKGSL